MYDFVWDGKPEKIKREVLTMGYESGGLKMIDLDNFIKSLKICWIKRMVEAENDAILNRIYINNLRPFGGKLLFECNILENDVCRYTQNRFLKDVLLAWCRCKANVVIPSYRHEILWNNSNIKAADNTIMFANWFNNGIKFFKDIYDDVTKKVYPYSKLREIINNLPEGDFLNYLTLIHNIPNSWKTNIKNENINTPKPTTILSQLIKNKHTNKYAYTLLQKMKIRPDKKSETKWTEQFNNENINWKTIYTTSLKATKDIKLQNFNYKFLMRIIPTNKFLLKCNIGHTALCEFCSMEIETLNHLFWECIHVQHFWTNLSVFLQEYNILIQFNLRNVMLGITEGTNITEIQIKNLIILLGKYFIFKTKYQKQYPTLIRFKSHLCQRIQIEKKIYFMKDRLAQFNNKWSTLRVLIE